MGRRIDRSVIANSIGKNAVILVDGDLVGLPLTPLPYDILRHWLKLNHPRLSPLSIEERFTKLVSDIKLDSSNSLTRKVLNDFPGRKWSQQFNNVIDTRSVSERGGEAALLFALEEGEMPIVVDWRWGYVKSLDRLVSDSRCRIVIGESIDLDLPFKLPLQEAGRASSILRCKVGCGYQYRWQMRQRCLWNGYLLNHLKS